MQDDSRNPGNSEENNMDGHPDYRRMLKAKLIELLESKDAEIEQYENAQRTLQQALNRFVLQQEVERRDISHTLHDDTSQSLTALMLGLKMLEDDMTGRRGEEAIRERLAQLHALNARIMEDIHTLARQLHPATLDILGLPLLLERSVDGWEDRYGVRVDFHSRGLAPERLPFHLEITLYRIVQEALSNVLRHADATQVSIILERRDREVLAIVEDDGGGGVEPGTPGTSQGLRRQSGLASMRDRIMAFGGTFQIESRPGAGTTLFVRLPCDLSGPETGEK